METQARLSAPSAARNREPIRAVLSPLLSPGARVLEVASGSGEHAVHMARARPDLTWQPSDPSPEARASIAAWIAAEGLANVRAPLALDASAAEWPVEGVEAADAVVCINMLHISPWAATEGLMRGAARLLPPGGVLYVYGAFRRAGLPTVESNAAFDADLRRRDARWGLRMLEDVAACAAGRGLDLDEVVEMPANNLSLVFRRRA
ncbi:DUF938 domain-containing protein [Xanthobacter sp. V2C-8]|uniref:DUF938 domain-containing protein n=1 Tax=Xanthobacter albus TaxID=3119929 RepID=UPI003728AFBE